MKVKNNTGTPRVEIAWTNVFLAILHGIVLVLSLAVHPITTYDAARALP